MDSIKSAFGMKSSHDAKNKQSRGGTSPNISQRAEEIRTHQTKIRQLAKVCEEMGMDTWSDYEYLKALRATNGDQMSAVQVLLEHNSGEQVQDEEPQEQMRKQASRESQGGAQDQGEMSSRRHQTDDKSQQSSGNLQKTRSHQDYIKQQQDIEARMKQQSSTQWQGKSSHQYDDQQITQRSQTQIQPNRNQPNTKIAYEPVPASERYRDDQVPSGLKNIGNTCYFASLMQVFFHLPNIQEKILSFNTNNKLNQIDIDQNKEMDQIEKIKIKSSRDLVKHVQYLFSMMLLSNVKYQDPTKVLESIVDDNGIGLSIYEQKDIGEFFLNFLERMQDGLGENKAMIRKLMGKDLNDATRASQHTSASSEQKYNHNPQDQHNNYMEMQREQLMGDKLQVIQNSNEPGIGEDVFSEHQQKESEGLQIEQQFEFEQHIDKMIDLHQQVGISSRVQSQNQEGNSLYGSGAPSSQSFFMRQQSMMDPDKSQTLMNYDLDEFKNSMWENFLGSQVQISKTVDADGTYKITNQNVDKMGPIQLRIEEDNLYQAWEKSRRSEIEGFKGDKPGQSKQIETWICRPPNVMMFQLNRVNYDMQKNKLVKDNSRFDFDKEIYLDLFLNQNKERSDKHRAELEKKKKELKKLKETYHQLTVQNDIVQKFTDCQEFISRNSTKENETLQNSIIVDGQKFAHLDVNKIHQNTLGITNAEIKVTLSVLQKYKDCAKKEINNLKIKIETLEKQCEQPYVKNKERPYQLHSIMIHDGLAENGHYYTYVYDRIQKCWWQLNDHKSMKVDEEQVMMEALGDDKKYKSACNLFYISQHIANQIDTHKIALFKKEHAKNLKITKEIRDQIHIDNCKFEIETQNAKIKLYVQKIHSIVKERLNIIENQSQNLEQIVQLKLYSFAQFLKIIEFKGYAKWTILNQAVKEEHPQHLSIADINMSRNEDEGGTPGGVRDEIYEGLLVHYADKFMSLTNQETKSVQSKKQEYKCLLNKSVYLTFMFINMNVMKIKDVLNVYATFKKYCCDLKAQFSSYTRIGDFDNIAIEIIQVFILNLIINMYTKYRSSKEFKRKDAQNSAVLASVILIQFFDKKMSHFKQFERALDEIQTYFSKQKSKQIEGADSEYEFYYSLQQKVKKQQYTDQDIFEITAEIPDLPQEVRQEFTKIEEIDCMEFVDGIDTESCSYKYYNSLNHFRYQNSGQILLQNNLLLKAPLSEANFIYQIDKLQIQISTQQLDFTDFKISKLVGRSAAGTNIIDGKVLMKNNYIAYGDL